MTILTAELKKRISNDLHVNSPRTVLKGSLFGMVVGFGLAPSEFRDWLTSLEDNKADSLAKDFCGTPDGQSLIEVGEEIIEDMDRFRL